MEKFPELDQEDTTGGEGSKLDEYNDFINLAVIDRVPPQNIERTFWRYEETRSYQQRSKTDAGKLLSSMSFYPLLFVVEILLVDLSTTPSWNPNRRDLSHHTKTT
jgi:hypothetical protein